MTKAKTMIFNHEELARRVQDERLCGNYLYVYEHDAWLRWDGALWAAVPRVKVREAIGNWAHDNFVLATMAEKDEDKKFWSAVCSYESQQALTELAEARLLHYAPEFDRNPLLLNCPNVTVDLATGEMPEHRRDDLITRVTAVDYKPDATHPDWDKALSALPEEVQEWYQLRMGQAITGKMTKNILFQIGNGENGKSAILDTIRFTLGSAAERGYSLLANRSVLTRDVNPSGINSALASFEGIRMATIEELDDSHHLSTTALKDLADTATISARHPYQRQNEFAATHSLFVNSNYNPSISEVDDGSWRRLLMVKFPYKFSESAKGTEVYRERDSTLKDRLREGIEQREACLAWLVAGAVAYHTADGASRFDNAPRSVEVWTKGWRSETDLIMLYVETFLIFDPRSAVRPDDLREHFNSWAVGLGHRPLTPQKFNARFAGHTLVTTNNVERDNVMRTNALRKVISYPPGAELLGPGAKMHKVWQGFRYRTIDDDVRESGGQWGTDF